MSFNKTSVSVRFMEALINKVRSKADKEDIYISDILEAGAITVLKKKRKEIIQTIEDFKGAK